ncbi:MAG: FIST N-terminal domain-containing protein, partial [Nanoarchaeota archaeon]
KSDYLHFGVGVAENYKKKPTEKGNKSIEQAMKNAKVDKYIDSFIQFTRIKTQDYSNIVKTPPYFIFTIIGSVIKKKGEAISGNESNFLEGIISKVGPHVPVFGLGSGSDFNKFIDDNTKETTNYQFANGKLYENSAITVFVISNLYFEIDVQHGYINTNKFAIITKIHKEGFDILELNGKEPVEEYCKLINVKKEEYLKDPFSYSLKNPFGITMMDNQIYIKEVYPNSDKKTLHSTYKLQKNTALNILKYDEKGLLTTMESIITKSKSKNKKKEIAFSLYTNCCSRRLLMDDKEKLANDILKKKHKNVPFFGCYAFSEIGSTKTNIAQVHGETVTALIIYDALLSDK